VDEVQELKETVKDPLLEYKLLGAYYQTINEYYPEFRIEYVCYDLNEVLPDSVVLDNIIKEAKQDMEFQKKLEERTTKKVRKSPNKDKYSLKTLEDIDDLGIFLKKNIMGQDEAIKSVCNAVKLRAANFVKHVNLFFIGKTGRGKTQLARKLGEKFSPNFWVINCAEYTNGHEVSKLLGSPPGYIGHSESSMMRDKAEKSNRWTIVFDEIEKAHSKFFNILLSLLDTGTVTDNSGNDIDLTDSMFIMTSNCGLKDLKTELLGFGAVPSAESHKEEIMKSLERTFSPEFRGRVDEFIFFNDLNSEDIRSIAKMTLSGYPVKTTPELLDYVVSKGFSDEFGARDIQRVVKNLVALPLANEILSNREPNNGSGKYETSVKEDKVEIINTIAI
jgi:ATP-dependent Clp protease ATP-binding subunit ClpA